MRLLVFLLCGLNPIVLILAQDISSQIMDSKSQLPIQYVNIGIVGKSYGTVSDSLGNFQLSLMNVPDTDILRISIIGYNTKDYKISDLRTTQLPSVILMDEKIVQLVEVVISGEKQEPILLGLEKKYSYPIPLFKGAQTKIPFPQKDYRHEIGTRFANSRAISLDSIQLNFAECNVDHVNLRINVYTISGDGINNILTQPIYISLSKKQASNFPRINLTNQNIEIDSDFLVTIENYKQLQDNALYILANFKSRGSAFPTYYRSNSHTNWIRLRSKKAKDIGLSFVAFVH